MKLNILLALVAITALSVLVYRWHRWSVRQDEWVCYWDGYFGSESVFYFPVGRTIILNGRDYGYYTQRRNLSERFANEPGISPDEMERLRKGAVAWAPKVKEGSK